MTQSSLRATERYYDDFSDSYEQQRHRGYHRMLDNLEVELALKYCTGKRVLEAGCGTGLILQRLDRAAARAIGVDLSGGMLSRARRRRLSAIQGSVDALPFADGFFDAVVSFKVLPHVPQISAALAELARVTRAGGALLLEFYNPHSLRHLIKRAKRPNRIGASHTDDDVYTRFDDISAIRSALPPGLTIERIRGVRIFTPAAPVHDLPLVGPLLRGAERAAADAPLLRRFGGFTIVVARKRLG